MRIHTDTLTWQSLYDFLPSGVALEVLSDHGSRKRSHAFEVQLSGSSNRKAQSGEWNAATWDEWGVFLGNLFRADPNATTQYYPTVTDFHRQTGERFANGVPADMHAQHKWKYNGSHLACTGCAAVRVR